MGRRRNRSAGASPVAPPASALPPPPAQFLQRQRRDDDTWSLVSGTSSFDVPSCASLALPSRDVVSLASYAPSVVSLASAPPSVVGEDLCTICCEPLDEPGTGVVCMPTCTHVYHGSCLRAWLHTAPTGGCPNCRGAADASAVRERAPLSAAALAALEKALEAGGGGSAWAGAGAAASDAGDDDARSVASVGSVTTVRGWPRLSEQAAAAAAQLHGDRLAVQGDLSLSANTFADVLRQAVAAPEPVVAAVATDGARPRVLAGPRPPRPRVIGGGRRRGARAFVQGGRVVLSAGPLGRIAEDAGSDSEEG